VDEKFSLIEAAGFHPSPRDRQLILPWFEPHTKPLVRFWGQEAALKDAPLRVVLSPTHRRDLRRWPLSSYAALADKLVQTNHASVIWLWGPGEEALVEEAMSLCQTRTFRAPATNFREMAAFIANCDLFIGNSNGPSHVAVATRICSLQIHGPTNAASWCPMTPQHQALQAVRGRMEEISVEALWEKLESMRPELEAFAAKRRTAGLRLNWRDP
jgi:ADP-heptose:LPS heptosyltransferase